MAPFLALLCALGFALAAVAAPTSKGHKFDWSKTKYVYAFGDSYTFVQGTEGLANFR